MSPREWNEAISPWTGAAPIVAETPLLRGADSLRRSLLPSLLEVRRINESLANKEIELFETAKVYLPQPSVAGTSVPASQSVLQDVGTKVPTTVPSGLPDEPWMLALVSSDDYFRVKGVVETLAAALKCMAEVEAHEVRLDLLDPARSCELRLGGDVLGYLGEISPQGLKTFGLRSPATVAELKLSVLQAHALLVPQYVAESPYPPISQDLNFIVDESLLWADLATTVRGAAGELLEQLDYRETYRNAEVDGTGKKRLLLSITLRSRTGTLTGKEAEDVRLRVVDACTRSHAARLVA
jgi:phenylalanyl-tRNA synthetase beta chain